MNFEIKFAIKELIKEKIVSWADFKYPNDKNARARFIHDAVEFLIMDDLVDQIIGLLRDGENDNIDTCPTEEMTKTP